MYAVIQTGGKQYKVAQGDNLIIEKIATDIGKSVDFNNVLLVGDKDNVEIGTPFVNGGKVTAMVQAQGRGKKIKIIKFKRRKHHLKRMGHRQSYTEVKITGIMADGFVAPPLLSIVADEHVAVPLPTEVEETGIKVTLPETGIKTQDVVATSSEKSETPPPALVTQPNETPSSGAGSKD